MNYVTGTCGYDYPEWVGEDRFYPASLARERDAWLTYYASQFRAVELDFPYYGEIKPRQLEQMLARVDPRRRLFLLEGTYEPQPEFKFFIKAYAALTHAITPEWRGVLAKYLDDVAPLRASGRLGGILAQFPASYPLTSESRSYVAELAQRCAPAPLIAEFRHARWYDQAVARDLRQAGAVLCGVDAPEEAQLPSVIDSAPEQGRLGLAEGEGEGGSGAAAAVVPLTYIRLHGRREGSWWSGDAASRYEYRYGPGTLARLAALLLKSKPDQVYLMFNNHRHADAASNARQLKEILDKLLQS